MLSSLLERLIVPPGGPLLCMLVGWLVRRRRPRTGRTLMVVGFLALYASTMPWVGWSLMRSLESVPPHAPHSDETDVIVVLGAGVTGDTPEYGGVTLGPLSLERVRWAARVQRDTGLPILVSGGLVRPSSVPVAELMRGCLEEDLGVPVEWVESASADTWENAARCAALLEPLGLRRVALVTHAWHMPRAVLAFEAHGLEVVPSPTSFHGSPPRLGTGLLPSSRALREVAWACHEWLGRFWYRIRSP